MLKVREMSSSQYFLLNIIFTQSRALDIALMPFNSLN